MTNLCLTLAESSLSKLEEKLRIFHGQVPFIELRLDYLESPRVPRLPKGRTRFIATCRPLREGGRFDGAEDRRLEILKQAASSGIHFLDLEYDVPELSDLPPGVRVVRSSHLFDEFPVNLDNWLDSVQRRKGDIHKLAAAVSSTRELGQLLSWMERLPEGLPRVVIGMGELGQPSRYLGGYLGNQWTYVVESDVVAPGQFSLDAAQQVFGLDQLEGIPLLFAHLSKPLEASPVPALFNHLFRRHGLNARCIPVVADSLEEWLNYLEGSRLDFSGLALGSAFGGEALKGLSSLPGPMGSVDTLRRTDGKWQGFEFGIESFLIPLLKRRPSLKNLRTLILGCGERAVRVATCLKSRGADVTLVASDRPRLEEISRQYRYRVASLDEIPGAEICVNATSPGEPIVGEALDAKLSQVRFAVAFDLVYNPKPTRFLQLAEASGAVVIPASEMLLEQVRQQFSNWTGIEPDRDVLGRLLLSGGER